MIFTLSSGQVPWLYWLHDALVPYIGTHLGIAARHGSLRTTAANEISARQTRGSDRKDILSNLLATHTAQPTAFDKQALTSMATSNIFAGSDTTAISTRAIIYHLLKNPASKAKLVAELDSARKEGKLSFPVSLAQADRLPYLQAVMYEALRLHPAVGMSLPRVSPSSGATIAGKFIPAGTTVGANPWVIHRDSRVFGDDVESFRPERWVEKSEAEGQDGAKGGYGDMQRFFFAFGAGARMCLGRNISWMEM
jgi:cytochrome P450